MVYFNKLPWASYVTEGLNMNLITKSEFNKMQLIHNSQRHNFNYLTVIGSIHEISIYSTENRYKTIE